MQQTSHRQITRSTSAVNSYLESGSDYVFCNVARGRVGRAMTIARAQRLHVQLVARSGVSAASSSTTRMPVTRRELGSVSAARPGQARHQATDVRGNVAHVHAPRHIEPTLPAEYSESSADQFALDSHDAAPPTTEWRGRGRPRKHPPPTAPVIASAERRRPGHPRKHPLPPPQAPKKPKPKYQAARKALRVPRLTRIAKASEAHPRSVAWLSGPVLQRNRFCGNRASSSSVDGVWGA
jgi:hypothetical protein